MESYSSSVQPFFQVLRFSGFCPMSFKEKNGKRSLQYTKLSMFRCFSLLVFLLIALILVVRNHLIFYGEKQDFLSLEIWSWLLMIVWPCVAIQIIGQIYKIADIRYFLYFMDEIDKKLLKISIKINHKKHRKIIFCGSCLLVLAFLGRITVCVAFLLINGEYLVTRGSLMVQEVMYAIFLYFEWMFIMQVCCVTFLLKERFKSLGTTLKYAFTPCYGKLLFFKFLIFMFQKSKISTKKIELQNLWKSLSRSL